ncbi:MAG: ABC transporter ATP-binding protein [Acidimicrobiales bacterium]
MLELHNVSGSYGAIRALDGLSVSLEDGETLALIGRNGAGKTTTLRLIAGVIRPVGGEISWMGDNIGAIPPERRIEKGMVLVPEGRGIFPSLSVEENLRMGGYSRRRAGRAELAETLDWVYSTVPVLGERRRQVGGSLSGGEQQLLAIGRGLMAKPRLLMLDEPSLGLSPGMTATLYDLLSRLKQQRMAMIIVEQFVHLVLELCDQVLGLANGRTAFLGNPADLVRNGGLSSLYMGGSEEGIEQLLEEELEHEMHL